jgi:2-amino-4-hydroxy-6-hydroxymethyldihydropteridine diphosphokinase
MSHRIFVGIGSNIDREKNIKSCMTRLKSIYGDMTISPVYETESMGFDGPNFYNLVSCFETYQSIYELKNTLNEIENDHGRHFNETKFSSRTLDIDILYYDDLVLSDDKIQIPRKEICEYDFVLKPLVDLVPDFIHPTRNISHKDMMNNIKIKKQIISTINIDL